MSETMRTIDQKIEMHNKHADKAIRLHRKHLEMAEKWSGIYAYHTISMAKLSKYTNTEVR